MKRSAALLLFACSGSDTGPPSNGSNPDLHLALQTVATGVDRPVYLTAPANDDRLFIVEQRGRIRIVKNGQLLTQPFLDITDRVTVLGGLGDERGLLGLAFHPSYASNRFLYVNYTDRAGDTRVERYTASSTNPDVADPASAKLILFQDQPFSNHNGGHLLFGPDGLLYIPLGDGGSGGDPQNNAQTLTTLLGKLLRIDVDGGDPYAVPSNNPFVGRSDARAEIWAFGLRNPWRMAFDQQSNLLFIADVGQGSQEEINAVPRTAAGLNYGWRIMEGNSCFNPSSCNSAGLTLPVHTYPTSGGNCAVTGGFVHRGAAIPELVGHYFFSDYCGGGVRSFRVVNGTVQSFRDWEITSTGNVSSFGEDSRGELYVISHSGNVSRIVRAP
jgi:glucose/arabinose dehydrogenase